MSTSVIEDRTQRRGASEMMRVVEDVFCEGHSYEEICSSVLLLVREELSEHWKELTAEQQSTLTDIQHHIDYSLDRYKRDLDTLPSDASMTLQTMAEYGAIHLAQIEVVAIFKHHWPD